MESLKGRVAMVTGGATGIGAATVERLTSLGADVACCYNTSRVGAEALGARLSEAGMDVFTVKIDVPSGQEVREGVASIAAHFGGPVDILVNNAGDNINPSSVDAMDESTWNRVISVNLSGAFLCAKYCIPGMKAARRGRIINITSISARTGGGPGSAHYAASKGGAGGVHPGTSQGTRTVRHHRQRGCAWCYRYAHPPTNEHTREP